MRRYLFTLPILLLLMVSAACADQVGTARQERQVRNIGQSSATTLASTLMSRVKQAMEEGGPVYALDFCSTRAQPLTADVNREIGPYDVKRTSFQYRNPLNAPDPYEAEALRYFEQQLAEQGTLSDDYVQFVHANEYRYYKPIVVQEMCLNCHGDPATFSTELTQVLNERYPDDRATGYAEGDFRGVIRVAVPTHLLP